MLTKQYNIDMTPGGIQTIIPLNQYESDVTLQFQLYSRDGSLAIESGTTAAFRGTKRDGNGIDTVTGVTLSGNSVTVQVSEQMTAAAGRNVFELYLEKDGKKLFSSNIVLMVERAALDKDTIRSDSVIRQFSDTLDRANEITQAAADAVQAREDTLALKEQTESAIAESAAAIQAVRDEGVSAVSEVKASSLSEIETARTDAVSVIGVERQEAVDELNDIFQIEFNNAIVPVETQLMSAVAGAYVEGGYLYMINSDGEVVVGPLGPFSGSGGGGGGEQNNAVLSMSNLSGWISKSISEGAACPVSFSWSSLEDEVPTGPGSLTILVNGIQKAISSVQQGTVSYDIGPFCSAGTNSVKVRVSDSYGNSRSINFTVTAIALSISSSFDVSSPFMGAFSFPFTPVGSVQKVVHFVLDGEELEPVSTSASGRQLSIQVPAQSHGAHSLVCFFESEINGEVVRSNVLHYEFVSVEADAEEPVITSSFHEVSAMQFSTIPIGFTVYTPGSLYSEVQIFDGEVLVSTQSVDRTEQVFSYRASEAGEVEIRIVSGSAERSIVFTVEPSDIQPVAESEDLALFLSSYGRSNNEAEPGVWEFGDVKAVLSGFNFKSDGWQKDEDGVSVLRVSGDARVVIPYKPFAVDCRGTGKTIELEFATRNILDYDSTIISCLDGERGFSLTAQRALLRSEQAQIGTQYKEDEHVRISFVVEKRSENRLIFIYINGIASGVVQYPENDDFSQVVPADISIGSSDCTLDLYCIRVYDNDLTRFQVVNNWIADTQVGELMVERFKRNDVFDDYGQIVISKLPADLPYMVLEAEALPQYKGDKKSVSGSFTDPADPERSFSFVGAQADVQGTSSQYYPRKNFKVKFKKGFTLADGSHSDVYEMNADAIGTSTFTFKADVASSEGANNVELVRLYNDACPYRTPYQVANPKVRQGIDGFPMVMFFDDGAGTSFVGKYNFNNDKGTEEVFGFQEGDESWEIRNNTGDRVVWRSDDFSSTKVNEDGKVVPAWLDDFEGRFPDGNENPVNLKALASWLKSTDQSQATGVVFESPVDFGETEQVLTQDEEGNDVWVSRSIVHERDDAAFRLAKFKAELPEHMEVQAVLFYYLFTELFLMVDSRAKNAFPSFMGGSKWFSLPYDFDTAIGINNEGSLVFGYELEDVDHTEGGADVFNGQDSVLWVNVRGAFFAELAAMYKELRSSGALSYAKVERMFEEHQAKWPEVIFNEDAWFKYIAPMTDPEEDAESKVAYLKMLQGSKAEQRKWWLYNRFRYIDSKYNAGDALTDVITLRGYAKDDVTVRPYADIYPSVKFGSYLVQKRGKRGVFTTLECPLDRVNDTEIYIYSASQLASVGDLSGLKVGLADFAAATRLQELKLGDADEAYSNGNLNDLTLGNNVLLKRIDVRNCPALTQSVDLRGCTNVEEVFFDGTSVSGVQLPNGGVLRVLHLPETVTNLTIRNQLSLSEFVLPSVERVTTLWLENVSDAVDVLALVSAVRDGTRVRLIGFSWEFESADEVLAVFDVFDRMRGLDEAGGNVDSIQVSGSVHVPNVTGAELLALRERYAGVKVLYDHIVSNLFYYDFDGSTLLYTEVVADGGDGHEFSGQPAKESTAQYDFAFAGWSLRPGQLAADASALRGVTEDRKVYAAYEASVRKYKVEFYNGSTLLETVTGVPYGGDAVYGGDVPVIADVEETEDYAFNGWDPLPESIIGDTKCYAQFRYKGYRYVQLLERNIEGKYQNDRVTKIGNRAFYGMKKMTEISCANVVTIEDYAFVEAVKLEVVDLPKAEVIGSNAFRRCVRLKTVNLGAARVIKGLAFRSCNSLETLSLPEVEQLEESALAEIERLVSLYLGDKLTSVGKNAIAFNSWLKDVHFGSKVALPDTAFTSCSGLKDIYVPWSEGEVSGAPWGATNAVVHYNSV